MTQYAMLIDYEYCTGCFTCEVACQIEHKFDPDTFGIKIHEIGPDEIAPKKWQYDYVPIPTDRCDHCAERVEKGKEPTCVKHCQAGVMSFGTVEELAGKMDGLHKALYTLP